MRDYFRNTSRVWVQRINKLKKTSSHSSFICWKKKWKKKKNRGKFNGMLEGKQHATVAPFFSWNRCSLKAKGLPTCRKTTSSYDLVVPTHLKHMFVNLDHLSKVRGGNLKTGHHLIISCWKKSYTTWDVQNPAPNRNKLPASTGDRRISFNHQQVPLWPFFFSPIFSSPP